jgi:hypothetical protein
VAVGHSGRYYGLSDAYRLKLETDMPLDEFKDQSFKNYLSTQTEGNGRLWVLVHVPKTSGTSLGSQLMRGRQPSRNIYVSWDGVKNVDRRKSLDLVLDDYLASQDIRGVRFMTGHFDARQTDRIQAARPDSRFITMLRNPVERVLSEYRYMLTEKHPAHLEFRASFPDIDRYIDHPRSQNVMFKRLAPLMPITNHEAFEFIRKRFTFIGLTEEYELSLRIISKLTGVPLDPLNHLNATIKTAVNDVVLTPERRARIEDTNKRDIALYRHFSNLFRRCARSMQTSAASSATVAIKAQA